MARKSSSHSSAAQKLGKSSKEREKEWEEEQWHDDERESFPQYCMTCEKQVNDGWLYCSEACRRHDQTSSGSIPTVRSYAATTTTYSSSHYPFYDVQKPEPRDIIPRAVPSRPNSTYFGSSTVSTDITANSGAQRLFSTSSARPQSPPSPTTASSGNLWPFSRSVATSPSGSYSNADDHHSSTTAGAYPSTYHVGTTGYGYAYGYSGMDRPLPSRQGGAYSRPKSIELVTPMISR